MSRQDQWTRRAVKILKAADRPLFAPTEEVLEVYRRRIMVAKERRSDQISVLILGMTPELADLALQLDCLVFRVDHSSKMIEMMRARQKVSNPDRDIVIQADWLDMHMIENGQFDLVLGDASLNNVSHENMFGLIDELLRVTHPGSLFSFKQFIIPDESIKSHEFDNVMSLFRQDKLAVFDLFRILHFYSFLSDAYDPSTKELHAPKVLESLKRKYNDGVLSEEEFKLLKSKNWNLVHTVYKCTEQKEIFRRLGNCSIVLPSNTPECRHMHVFSIDRE